MLLLVFFFFNDTATTEIYTLSLHDALPIFLDGKAGFYFAFFQALWFRMLVDAKLHEKDRKSTRLNSSHTVISYAVFCLKKKKITNYLFFSHKQKKKKKIKT